MKLPSSQYCNDSMRTDVCELRVYEQAYVGYAFVGQLKNIFKKIKNIKCKNIFKKYKHLLGYGSVSNLITVSSRSTSHISAIFIAMQVYYCGMLKILFSVIFSMIDFSFVSQSIYSVSCCYTIYLACMSGMLWQ